MPFDALVAAPRQKTIADLLEDHRLSAVPWKQLAEHKAAQQQKYGPSFWHRHQAAVSILLVVTSPLAGAIAAASGGFNAHSGVLAITGSFVWMCMVALITGTGMIRLRGGSHWEEREVLTYADVPEPIARVARALKAEMPRTRLILGELKREETVLDPYLLIEHDGESVCLGIWEDDKIIACTESAIRR
ncbi:MAG TPA: hypothetical protein VFE12_15785 [Acetobacteraceae bacterium]|jgi:Flp pilus assembly protein TadB|nr:hypothetical protein [Acetobacteraceae bacterium]